MQREPMLRTVLVLFVVALAGCASPPSAPPSAPPQDGEGRILMRPWYVPNGTGNNAIAVFLAGGSTPIRIPLYDVTGEPRWLGELHSQGARSANWQPAFEYDVSPGKRVLMLYMRKFGGGDFVDFIEVPVTANRIEHVALSQYGMNDRPFFASIPLDDRSSRFCLTREPKSIGDTAKTLKEYGSYEPYRVDYCRVLATTTQFQKVPAGGGMWQGPLTREKVTALRDRYLPVWRKMADRMPPYELD